MKNVFVTVLSTEEYLDGVLVLNESLKKSNSQYPLYVLVTSKISEETENILKKFEINVIKKEPIQVPGKIVEKNKNGRFPHWANTFDKLLIFDLIEFDKIVYIDSDMYVLHSIDELFSKKDMSATIDRRHGPAIEQDWIKLTSGIMVVEPKEGRINKFRHIMSSIADRKDAIGDQDVLQEYDTEWESKRELHLDIKYNMFFPHLDYYINFGGYDLEDINVIHFILERKPWTLKRIEVTEYIESLNKRTENNYKSHQTEILEKAIKAGNYARIAVLEKYFDTLEAIREKKNVV